MRSRVPIWCLVLSVGLCAAAHPLPASAAGVSVDQANWKQRQAAQKEYNRGLKAMKAGKLDEAVAAFQASYDVVASPNSRLMVARALADQGKVLEAHKEMSAAIEEAKALGEKSEKYKKTAETAQQELSDLEAKLAFITVELSDPPEEATILIDDEPVDRSEWGSPIMRAPGSVVVVAKAPGTKEVRREVELNAGSRETISLELEAIVEATEPEPAPVVEAEASTSNVDLRTWAYVAGGVGAAGLLTFTIFGLMHKSKYGDLEEECWSGTFCAPDQQDNIDAGRRYQTIANVGLGIGVVGLGTGVTLFLLSKPKKESDAGEATSKSPTLMVGTNSVLVRGRF